MSTARELSLLLRENGQYVFYLLLLFLLALSLRLHDLDQESMFMDEIRQVSYYKESFVSIISSAASQQQPPLDYWLGHLVFKVSDSDFAARLPAALFGVASVILFVLITSRICNWPFALFGGLIMALLPFHIYYSQEARPYSIGLFFFLATFGLLRYILETAEPRKIAFQLLLPSSLLFLLSRALFPLCAVTSFYIIVMFQALRARYGGNPDPLYYKKCVKSLVILSISLLLYLPLLLGLLESGDRFLQSGSEIAGSTGLWFSSKEYFAPLWRAFAAQLEPLEYIVGIAVLLSSFIILTGRGRKLIFPAAILILLAAINIVVFNLKSNSVFRPPYAIYILPLVLMLFIGIIQQIWSFSLDKWNTVTARVTLVFSAVLLTVYVASSMLEFKSRQIKTDWRGLSSYTSEHINNEQILVFDSLSRASEWKPLFYGFSRYDPGNVITISTRKIIEGAATLSQVVKEPVLVLFSFRDYRLTSASKYEIISKYQESPVLENNIFQGNGTVNVTNYTGLTVLSLKQSEGHFLRDTFTLVNEVVNRLPDGPALVDMYFSLAAIAAVCVEDDVLYQGLAVKARELSLDEEKDVVNHRLNNIKSQREHYRNNKVDNCRL